MKKRRRKNDLYQDHLLPHRAQGPDPVHIQTNAQRIRSPAIEEEEKRAGALLPVRALLIHETKEEGRRIREAPRKTKREKEKEEGIETVESVIRVAAVVVIARVTIRSLLKRRKLRKRSLKSSNLIHSIKKSYKWLE